MKHYSKVIIDLLHILTSMNLNEQEITALTSTSTIDHEEEIAMTITLDTKKLN
jgi:hypothetical protein